MFPLVLTQNRTQYVCMESSHRSSSVQQSEFKACYHLLVSQFDPLWSNLYSSQFHVIGEMKLVFLVYTLYSLSKWVNCR